MVADSIRRPAISAGPPRFFTVRHRRTAAHAHRLSRQARPAGRLHLQPLPYVQAILDRLIRDARELRALGIGVVAISSNDAVAYPQDSFAAMAALASDRGFRSPTSTTDAGRRARRLWRRLHAGFFGFNAPTCSCSTAAA